MEKSITARHVAELSAENAKLRHDLEEANNQAEEVCIENAKLRELVQKFAEYVSQDRCLGCVVKSRCCDGEVDECWLLTEIRNEAHELGVDA